MIGLAVFGLLIPNGAFIYFFVTDPQVTRAAMTNPISLVFMFEAFVLMLLFAWLLRRAGVRRPSGLVFIVMSLIGSMVFSVPAALALVFRYADHEGEASAGGSERDLRSS
ncbi:MAG: hypothetical protein CMJ49_01215 [Planctomycetaceae bacterium]|nr:hypothetical protein [Planctomycetaceae bacterium]